MTGPAVIVKLTPPPLTGGYQEDWEWGRAVSRETYVRAKQGDWSVLLTPTRPVPKDWFCPMENVRIQGLASGRGQQMPVFPLLAPAVPI